MSIENTAVQSTLTVDQTTSFDDIGSTLGASDIDRDTAIDLFFNLVFINGSVDYTLWVEGSKRIMNAYAIKKGIKCIMQDGTLNPTVKNMWSRFTKDIADKHGIVKPIKPTTEAKAKSEQRAKAEAKLELLKVKPVEELETELKAKLANPTTANLTEAKNITKAIEAKAKDIEKAESAEVSELRKDIKALLAKIESADVLRDVRQYLTEII
jgi:uncharacterized protein with von Willebrand factor type A (vWA) domain